MKSWVTAGSVAPVDLVAALVDLVLLLRLPELVDPAEAVVGREDVARQAREQLLQREPVLGGELDLQQHVVGAEDFAAASGWRTGPPGRSRSAASSAGQFLALLQA